MTTVNLEPDVFHRRLNCGVGLRCLPYQAWRVKAVTTAKCFTIVTLINRNISLVGNLLFFESIRQVPVRSQLFRTFPIILLLSEQQRQQLNSQHNLHNRIIMVKLGIVFLASADSDSFLCHCSMRHRAIRCWWS